MNKSIIDPNNYTFDASAGTITFKSAYGVVPIEKILIITNLETNTIVYNFACVGFGGTIQGFTLTLNADTSAMNDDDALQIIVYQEPDVANKATLMQLELQTLNLQALQSILEEQQFTNELLKEVLNG